MDDATKKGLKANEEVVAKSELKKAEARIRELERGLGRKTMENEILRGGEDCPGKKVDLGRQLGECVRFFVFAETPRLQMGSRPSKCRASWLTA